MFCAAHGTTFDASVTMKVHTGISRAVAYAIFVVASDIVEQQIAMSVIYRDFFSVACTRPRAKLSKNHSVNVVLNSIHYLRLCLSC